ncbi:MAG: PASTA domain-containing protein [Solirubrobacteraceae bacterium]|nr:PASTA domain-containing protein [Solirubrobacteraceae bacterium]
MVCPGCSEEIADGADFCPHCKRYLRWEPTGYMPAIKSPAGSESAAGAGETPTRTAGEPAAAPAGRGDRQPLASTPAPEARPAAKGARPDAVITLTVPGVEPPAAGAPAAIAIEPGQRGRVLATVRNQSDIVDNYDLTLEGLPEGWATLSPATVHLMPFRSSRTYEAEIEITLHPPRTPQAQARHWPTTVVATSRSSGERVATVPLEIGLLPFEQLELAAKPERRAGRRRARFEVTVRNKANAAAAVALAARDTDGACRIKLDHETLTIPEGQTGTATLTVRPPRQRWIGRPFDWRIEIVHATGDEGERLLATAAAEAKQGKGRRKLPGVNAPSAALPSFTVGSDGIRTSGPRLQAPEMPRLHVGGNAVDLRRLRPGGAAAAPAAAPAAPLLPGQVVYRQRAWLPWWLAVVIPMLAALLLMLFLFLPRTATVPKLEGAPSVLVAQQRLAKVGLVLDPNREQVVRAGVRAGSVIKQVPAAGEKLEKGKAVTVQVAVGSSAVEVPKIVGQTLPEAEKTLRAAGLGVGRTSMTPPDLKAKITTQIPEAGEQVKAGAPIDIYYGKPKGAGGGAGGGGGDIAMPPIDPPDAAGFAAKLSDTGLVPQVVRQLSTVKRGDVVATDPAAGAKLGKGETVKLTVSAGFPQIVFDDDQDLLRFDPATGKALPPLAKTAAIEKDPTWSADGTKVAYNADGRIMLVDTTQQGATPIALTPAGERYSDPSFSPSAERQVLAVAKVNADGDRDLCLAPMPAGTSEIRPQCLTDPSFSVSDAKWSADGRTILVPALRKDGAFGLVRYRSARAFSSRTLDWKGGTIVTPRDKSGPTGVRDGAFSPDGKQLALVANVDSPQFQLYVTTPDDLRLEQAKALPVQACKVAWRPDSKELLVTQSGADCTQPTGQLLRVGLGPDAKAEPVSAEGDNASYQPVVGGG